MFKKPTWSLTPLNGPLCKQNVPPSSPDPILPPKTKSKLNTVSGVHSFSFVVRVNTLTRFLTPRLPSWFRPSRFRNRSPRFRIHLRIHRLLHLILRSRHPSNSTLTNRLHLPRRRIRISNFWIQPYFTWSTTNRLFCFFCSGVIHFRWIVSYVHLDRQFVLHG